jgi:arylsulfatase A-like enzyme
MRNRGFSRARAALVGSGIAAGTIALVFVGEGLLLLGTIDPEKVRVLQSYADIPSSVSGALARQLVFGTAQVYLAVAAYAALAFWGLHFVWHEDAEKRSFGRVLLVTWGVLAWVGVSASLRLLAIHPYAAGAIPFGAIIEPSLRSWWTPAFANAATALLAVAVVLGLSFRESLGRIGRRAVTLLLFVPLLGPSVSSLEVEEPSKGASLGEFARPPVVLIGIDSLRRDHVSRWGAPSGLTPHLDEFLADSYEFPNAWTVVGRTHPSYVSLLTAQTPDRHGVRYNRADPYFAQRLPKTLGHSLIEAGYSTRYMTDDNMFSSMGLAHGYQSVGQPPSMLETYAARNFMGFFFLSALPAKWTSRFMPALLYNRAMHFNYDAKDFSDAVSEAVDEKVAEGRPFFLTAHLCSNHYPGSQPGPEYRRFQKGDVPAIDYFQASLKHFKDGDMHIPEVRDEKLRALYKAGVVRVDAELGRILNHLKEVGLFDKAWIVVWSDHGESFKDKRGAPILPSHGLAVDEGGEDLKIVLGMRPPGGAKRTIPSTVRSIDVAPTLLASLGLPPLDGPREGRSLVPLFSGEALDEPFLYAESGIHYGRKIDASTAKYRFDLLRLYRYHKASGELVTRRQFHDQLVTAKQRMVQKGHLRLVYEPLANGTQRRRLLDLRRAGASGEDWTASYPVEFQALNEELERHLVDLKPESLMSVVKDEGLKRSKVPWFLLPPEEVRQTKGGHP